MMTLALKSKQRQVNLHVNFKSLLILYTQEDSTLMEIWNDDQFDLDLAIHINETARNAQTVANEAKTHG